MDVQWPSRVHIENICLTLTQNTASKRAQQRKYESAYKSMTFNMNLRRIARSPGMAIFTNIRTISWLHGSECVGSNWYSTCEDNGQ